MELLPVEELQEFSSERRKCRTEIKDSTSESKELRAALLGEVNKAKRQDRKAQTIILVRGPKTERGSS